MFRPYRSQLVLKGTLYCLGCAYVFGNSAWALDSEQSLLEFVSEASDADSSEVKEGYEGLVEQIRESKKNKGESALQEQEEKVKKLVDESKVYEAVLAYSKSLQSARGAGLEQKLKALNEKKPTPAFSISKVSALGLRPLVTEFSVHVEPNKDSPQYKQNSESWDGFIKELNAKFAEKKIEIATAGVDQTDNKMKVEKLLMESLGRKGILASYLSDNEVTYDKKFEYSDIRKEQEKLKEMKNPALAGQAQKNLELRVKLLNYLKSNKPSKSPCQTLIKAVGFKSLPKKSQEDCADFDPAKEDADKSRKEKDRQEQEAQQKQSAMRAQAVAQVAEAACSQVAQEQMLRDQHTKIVETISPLMNGLRQNIHAALQKWVAVSNPSAGAEFDPFLHLDMKVSDDLFAPTFSTGDSSAPPEIPMECIDEAKRSLREANLNMDQLQSLQTRMSTIVTVSNSVDINIQGEVSQYFIAPQTQIDANGRPIPPDPVVAERMNQAAALKAEVVNDPRFKALLPKRLKAMCMMTAINDAKQKILDNQTKVSPLNLQRGGPVNVGSPPTSVINNNSSGRGIVPSSAGSNRNSSRLLN